MSLLLLIGGLLRLLEILIIIRVILSFVPAWQRNSVGIIVVAVTEPLLLPFRNTARVQGAGMGLDFSPMILLLIIHVVRLLLHV